MSRGPWQTAALVTFAIGIVAAGLAALAGGRFTWGQPELPKAQCEALIGPVAAPSPTARVIPRYQDRIATAVVREPQNTWSNLGFVIVGVLIAARDRRTFSRLLGIAVLGLGLASGLYHASLLPAWRTVDVATMGWVTFALSCVGLAAVWPAAVGKLARFHRPIALIGSVFALAAGVFRNDVRIAGIKPFDSTYTTIAGVALVFVLLVAGLVWRAGISRGSRWLWCRLCAMSVVTGAAIICQLGDHPGRWFCRPDSAVQAHAVWHILMASAVALAYDAFALIEAAQPSGGVTGKFPSANGATQFEPRPTA